MFVINAIDLIPPVCISSNVEQSIANYLINNTNSEFIGRMIQSTSYLFDKIEPSEDTNLILNSGLIADEKSKSNILKLFTNSFVKITKTRQLFPRLFVYHKTNQKIARKIWTIFPNINFQLNQIVNTSLSNTQLNKFLISKTYKINDKEAKDYKNGLLTLSKENRLITLTDKIKHKNHVIIGIWLNLKEEQPEANETDLERLLLKYQMVIYQKCFEFIEQSSEIESVFSPSPDESVFLLVLFYHGIQCHYEVKVVLGNCNEGNCNLNKFCLNMENKWIIAKNKTQVDHSFTSSYIFDLKTKMNKEPSMQLLPVSDYMNKKFKVNNQVSILTKSQVMNEPSNNTLILPINEKCNNNEKDRTDEQLKELLSNTYLDIDSFEDLYDYPLIMPSQLQRPQIPSINKMTIHKANTMNSIKGSTLAPQQLQQKKQNEELFYSHASTNSHSNLLLSLKHSENSNNNNHLLHQYTQKLFEQSNTLKNLNRHVSQLEEKAHQLLNRILMSKKHTNTIPISQSKNSNISIQVPHIYSIDLTFNEDE